MNLARLTLVAAAVTGLLGFGGCATKAPAHDYSAFMKAKPTTLLVMPPVNDSPEVNATHGVWSHATLPMAEAGYYVLPVTLVDRPSGRTALPARPMHRRSRLRSCASFSVPMRRSA